MELNSPNKSEMPKASIPSANLGNRTVGGCNAMTQLFYHVTPQIDNEPLMKIGGVE